MTTAVLVDFFNLFPDEKCGIRNAEVINENLVVKIYPWKIVYSFFLFESQEKQMLLPVLIIWCLFVIPSNLI